MIKMLSEENPGSRKLPSLASFAISLCLHAIVISALWLLPPFPNTVWSAQNNRRPIEIETAKPRTIIWLRRNQRLPDISPSSSQATTATPRKLSDQPSIHVSPPNATRTDQFIYVPLPKPVEQQPLPSPNVVMTRQPAAQPTRKFVAPVEQPRQVHPTELVEPALARQQGPNVDKNPLSSLSKINAPKPEPKKFTLQPEKPRQIATRVIDEPDGLPIQPSSIQDVKVALPRGQLDTTPKAPLRKFEAPAGIAGRNGLGGASKGSSNGSTLNMPDVEPGQGQGQAGIPGEISAVILSANPLANGAIIPPEGNRSAKINAGATTGSANGNGDSGGSKSGLVVPNVTVQGGKGGDGPGVMAANKTPAAPSPAAAMAIPTRPPPYRPRLDTPSVSVPQWPASRHVPPQVNSAFLNRVVYCTVMPGPSDLQDWVVWFGEATAPVSGSRTVMRPPTAQKTQFQPSTGGPALEGKIWISARLGKNGRLTAVTVPPGSVAQRMPELVAEMEKWLFTPAIRNGEAVDVDLLMEASFQVGRR
ncbi:MAG: hypothetical protein J0H49_29315 [Acidobacteria bacterium]|nr:hypothetical protein [Acidobacteriota bacterium]